MLPSTFINERTGELALKLNRTSPCANPFDHLYRFNYYRTWGLCKTIFAKPQRGDICQNGIRVSPL